jgi:DNA invertase Pin-like site-specific DNA recombinase
MRADRSKAPQSPQQVAYSYIRFSTPEQAQGDSLRRQTEAAAAWCERNNARLNTTTTLHDLGTSAFTGAHRENPDRNALASFLKLVEGGYVPRGSYLVVEALDRLTREDTLPALSLLLNLLQAGVRVVQLKPVEMVYDDKANPMHVMMMIMELSRGHSESAMKSERVAAAWVNKRARAREGAAQPPRDKDGRVTRSLTDRLPAWVEDAGGELRLVPDRAAVVKRIFRLAAGGYGIGSIVKRLVADGVPPFGVCVDGPGGGRKGRRAKPGATFGSGRWDRTLVARLLKDRRALGIFQPRRVAVDPDGKRRSRPDGPPIADYYPAAVSDAEWAAARNAMTGRRHKPGRLGHRVANLFGGLLRNARDGETYIAVTRQHKDRPRKGRPAKGETAPPPELPGVTYNRVLVNSGNNKRREAAFSFPLDPFERGLLSRLAELDPCDVLPRPDGRPPDDLAAIEGELARVREEIEAFRAALTAANVKTIAEELAKREAREGELVTRLAAAREAAARPAEVGWRDCQGLIGVLDAAATPEEVEDVRTRLRGALRRIIDSVWLVVVPRGRTRLCLAQVFFRGNDGGAVAWRLYQLIHRQRVGGVVRRPEAWAVLSYNAQESAAAGLPATWVDLRDPSDAACAVATLEGMTAERIAELLAEGQSAPEPEAGAGKPSRRHKR